MSVRVRMNAMDGWMDVMDGWMDGCTYPKSCRATARMVEVLPVPEMGRYVGVM